MMVLVACEFSSIVRDAFARKGHNAWSCDIIPSERGGKHMQCDVREVLDYGWDLMIGHPPCEHLAVSGARYFAEKREDSRQQRAIDFFMLLVNAPIPKIAIENPVGIMSTLYRKPDQIIQPWMFGEDASKKTCLWLKNLPLLVPTDIIIKHRYANQTASGQNKLGPSPTRAKDRARTYEKVAAAMADQWG